MRHAANRAVTMRRSHAAPASPRAHPHPRPALTRIPVDASALEPGAERAAERNVAPAPADPSRRTRPRATLLIVDDDEAVRTTTAMILQDYGYSVLECESGAGALELLRGQPDISLLLTDVVMPGMDGAQLALHARAMRQTLPIVFFSGYTDPRSMAAEVVLEPILRKPFRASELVAQIESALAGAKPRF